MSSINIRIADWQADHDLISLVRKQVFIHEQGIEETLEWDELDKNATHFLALTSEGNAVGVARLTDNGAVGRMAVLRKYRHQGIARQLLHSIIEHARCLNFDYLSLHAQLHAVGFYQKVGFQCQGEQFEEAGLPHQAMLLNIKANNDARPNH
jgi:predicted GNAT family N-acyltransferase